MEFADNTFQGGMMLDYHPLTMQNTALSGALNATLQTFNGNENNLQNDLGNIECGELPEGYIPLSTVSFGNIIYILSYSQTDKKYELGSFPSPDYTKCMDEPNKSFPLLIQYSALQNCLNESNNLVKFNTDFLEYDLTNAVNIIAEETYDRSVNLIINDGVHEPKLINTSFSVDENSNATFIKRYSSNNTNRYSLTDLITFNLQTSLYTDISKISNFTFDGLTISGNLPVGNYSFYAIACDKDGNESDIICESGVIPVFLGTNGDPFSVNGGILNLVSDKAIKLTVTNLDNSCHYIKLYYSRASSANNEEAITLVKKIVKAYPVNHSNGESNCSITVTGYEETEDVPISSLNIQYFNADAAKALALCCNYLFLGNLTENNEKTASEYDTLKKISFKFYPLMSIQKDYNLNHNYLYNDGNLNSYYNADFCYKFTGYHENEIYRFGIVYIRKDNSLTSVFDVLGVNLLKDSNLAGIPLNITAYDRAKPYINGEGNSWETSNVYDNNGFNIYGVCRTGKVEKLTDIIGISFVNQLDSNDRNTLEKNYKGYFFVRQKRIPTFLALGYATNICENAFLPSINVADTNNNKRYLYESFVQGSYHNANNVANYSNFYPPRLGKSPLTLLLSYSLHLFSLTDHCYGYFDKRMSTDAVNEFWEAYGHDCDNEFFYFGSTIAVTGGDEDNEYLLFSLSNGDGTEKKEYKCVFYTYRKLSNSEAGGVRDLLSDSNPPTDGYNSWDLSLALNMLTEKFSEIKNEDIIITYTFPGLHQSQTFTIQGPAKARYIQYDGNIYQIEACSGELKSHYQSYLIRYIKSYFNNHTAPEQQVLEGTYDKGNKGYNLEIPTYTGKFYYPKIKGKDECAVKINPLEYNSYAIYCPEYYINKPYFNNIFTGQEVVMQKATKSAYLQTDSNRLYYFNETTTPSDQDLEYFKSFALSIDEEVSLNAINHLKDLGEKEYMYRPKQAFFSSKAGDFSTASFKFAGPEFLAYNFPTAAEEAKWTGNKEYSNWDYNLFYDRPFNIVRGIYSAYVGAYPYKKDDNTEKGVEIANHIINIYIPNYDVNLMGEYFKLRFDDATAYQAISDKFSIDSLDKKSPICYRGDCFINWYTQRINRNFNDNAAPYNDEILDKHCFWKGFEKNFDLEYRKFDLSKDSESATKINLGDINAVKLGSWITFPVRSSVNLSLRSSDASWTTEAFESKNDRSFYPLHSIDASGSYKISESDCYNTGFTKSGNDKLYFNLQLDIYNLVYYKNRVVYSNVGVDGSYTNGHKTFLATHHQDYSDQYGSIVKLVEWYGDIVCILEHGVYKLPIKERVVAAQGSGGSVYINTSNVLPETPYIISEQYGTQWADSVIKTPYGIYGVDATSKKIWRIQGDGRLNTISDYAIQSFLNRSLGMYDSQRKLGEINIKTHYNAFKHDVIFTAYDYNQLILWSLCYNEGLASSGLNGWITFYSWIPSCSENIGNTFITFNLQVDTNILNNSINIDDAGTTNKLWAHGQSDFILDTNNIKPCLWYGKLHPFEFEFIVNKNPINHKIFNDLKILSNKAAPESFHYEVVGLAYNFSNDRSNMYYRQELQKAFFKACGENIEYDKTFTNITPVYSSVNYYLPLYYRHKNNTNLIEDSYLSYVVANKGYLFMAGAEIIHDDLLNEYRICNHMPGADLLKVGRLRGNMHYKEDIWYIQLNSIPYYLKQEFKNENEFKAYGGKYKMIIPVPNIPENALKATSNELDELNKATGLQYNLSDIDTTFLQSGRKEIRPKDKYIKIRIRYPGNDLAIITAVMTSYSISYS